MVKNDLHQIWSGDFFLPVLKLGGSFATELYHSAGVVWVCIQFYSSMILYFLFFLPGQRITEQAGVVLTLDPKPIEVI